MYGQKFGTSGQPWSGAFMQYVFLEAGIKTEPALLDPGHALAEYITQKRTVKPGKEARGDLIILAGSLPFETYRIAIVTEPGTAIGGMFAPGPGRESDAVVRFTYYPTDVIATVRPKYTEVSQLDRTDSENADSAPRLHIDRIATGRLSKSTRQLQLALHETVGLAEDKMGLFTTRTRSALRRYEQRIGYVTGDGSPNERVLRQLSRDTDQKYFVI